MPTDAKFKELLNNIVSAREGERGHHLVDLLHGLAMAVRDTRDEVRAIAAESARMADLEARGNLAGALGLPVETGWDDLIASAKATAAALKAQRSVSSTISDRADDLARQREALQNELAKEAARADSACLERDAALRAKASAQADADALMKALREHDGKEQSMRAVADDMASQIARIREDLAKEIAAHLETKAKLQEMEDKASRHEHMRTMAEHDREQAEEDAAAGSAAFRTLDRIREALGARDGEQAIAAAQRVAGELAAAQKQIADIKSRPFEFLHGLGYRAPNGGGSITIAAIPFLDVVFDGPPGPQSGRFVEVEDEHGQSVNVGEWIDRGNGLWALRVLMPRPPRSSIAVELREALGAKEDETILDAAKRLRAEADGLRKSADALLKELAWWQAPPAGQPKRSPGCSGPWDAGKSGDDAPADPKDSDAPVAAFAPGPMVQRIAIQNLYGEQIRNAMEDSDAPVSAFASVPENPWPDVDIVKLTPDELSALRLPDPGMFHGQPAAWYRRGDRLFIGFADTSPDFDGNGPSDSILRRSLSVIADLQERLKVTGEALEAATKDRDPAGLDIALVMLDAEAKRLRSGAGGFGGRSPHALGLADAIQLVIGCFK